MPNRYRTLALMIGAITATAILATIATASVRTEPAPAFVTDTTLTPQRNQDISGPCDEAEHANDPRCTGSARPSPRPSASASEDGDISGPCDEAEHANDPRCTGEGDDDDRSGRRGGDDDDRSGSNSGPGSGSDDDDDRSGSSSDSDSDSDDD